MREYSGFFMGDLTPKQEKFAQCVADGMSQADAYRVAYDCAPSTKAESKQATHEETGKTYAELKNDH